MHKKNLVILDFDGTIVDTAPDIIAAVNRLLINNQLKPLEPSHIIAHIGHGLKQLIVDLFKHVPMKPDSEQKLIDQFLKIYEEECVKQVTVFAGVLEFLSQSPHNVAIVSNKKEAFIHRILKHLNLDNKPWAAVVGGDTFSQMKPHPLPFEEVMKKVGVTADNTLIVGDGIPDVQGALNIGARCAVVSYGYLPAHELLSLGAHFQISSLLEISEVWP